MGKKNGAKINQLFVDEYKAFLDGYLLRLLGFIGKTVEKNENYTPENTELVAQDDRIIVFSVGHWRLFELVLEDGTNKLSDDNLALAICIVKEFLVISEYKWNGSS